MAKCCGLPPYLLLVDRVSLYECEMIFQSFVFLLKIKYLDAQHDLHFFRLIQNHSSIHVVLDLINFLILLSQLPRLFSFHLYVSASLGITLPLSHLILPPRSYSID